MPSSWFGWWDKGFAPCSKFQMMLSEGKWLIPSDKALTQKDFGKHENCTKNFLKFSREKFLVLFWGGITSHISTGWKLNGWDYKRESGCQNVWGGHSLLSLQVVQTAHGVISGEEDSGKLLPHLFIPGETSFEPTRMSRTLKAHQRSAKTFTEGQKIFKEKVRELSLFVLEEETQDGGAAACIGVRGKLEGWWRKTLFGSGREYKGETDTNHGLGGWDKSDV